jgi:hypothetical protein
MDSTEPKSMKIITDKTGAKRRIYSYGYDLQPVEGYLLVSGQYNLDGKRKSDCWYVAASDSIQEKTQAEKDAGKAAIDADRKTNECTFLLVKMILESTSYAELKTKVQAAIDAARSK